MPTSARPALSLDDAAAAAKSESISDAFALERAMNAAGDRAIVNLTRSGSLVTPRHEDAPAPRQSQRPVTVPLHVHRAVTPSRFILQRTGLTSAPDEEPKLEFAHGRLPTRERLGIHLDNLERRLDPRTAARHATAIPAPLSSQARHSPRRTVSQCGVVVLRRNGETSATTNAKALPPPMHPTRYQAAVEGKTAVVAVAMRGERPTSASHQ